jgi:N-acetylmuramoyl-L-alanine amidase
MLQSKRQNSIAKKILLVCLAIVFFYTHSAYRKESSKTFIVVLDAGHGGTDPGTMGTGRYKDSEKDIALEVTLKVGAMIEENFPNVKVIYTRKGDTFPTLKQRTQIANNANADLFISIHCNANPNSEPSGSETYVMGLAKSDESLNIAMKENAAIYLESNKGTDYDGFDPKNPDTYIILSLRENLYLDKSITLAKNIQDEFKSIGRKNRGVKQAPYYVITFTNMPSVLIELGFMSNPTEEDYLQSKEGKENLSLSIYKAFKSYYSQNSNSENQLNNDSQNENENNTVSGDGLVWKDEPANTLVFKVQILSSAVPISKNSADFRGLKRIEEYLSNGTHKYVAGCTTDLNEAKQNQKLLRDKGFSGAFIVAFENGQRISMEEALKRIQK